MAGPNPAVNDRTDMTAFAAHQFRWGRALAIAICQAQGQKHAVQARQRKARKADASDLRQFAPLVTAGLSVGAAQTYLDGVTAWHVTGLAIGSSEFFLSSAHLARTLGVSINSADASLRRLVNAAWLIKLPAAKTDNRSAGRPATRYRIPDIFPTVVGELFSPITVGEIHAAEKGISPSTVGGDSPSVLGSIRKTESGAGARSGAHLSPEQDIPVLDDEEDVESAIVDSDARERVLSPSPPSIAPTESASEQYDDRDHNDTITLFLSDHPATSLPFDLAREWEEADRFRDSPGDEGDHGGDLEPNILEDNGPFAGEDDATAHDRNAEYLTAFSDLRRVLHELGVATFDLNLWANSVVTAVMYEAPSTMGGAVDRVAELVIERPWLAADLANALEQILTLCDPENASEAMDCALEALFDGADPRIQTTKEVRRG